MYRIVPPSFNKGIYANACVVEGEEVLTLRPEEGVAKAFRGHIKSPERDRGAAVDGGGLDSAVSGAVSVNQRRGVDRNPR